MKRIIAGLLVSLLLVTPAFAWNGTISNDLMHTYQWSGPSSVKQGSDLYVAGVTSQGQERIFKHSGNGTVTNFILTTFPEADDHNTPAILAQPNKDVVTFYTRHNLDNDIRTRRAAANTLSFGSQTNITFSDTVTYAQVWSYEDRVILLTRVARCKWVYKISEDYAETWGDEITLFDNCSSNDLIYALMQPDTTGVFHIAFYSHPTSSSWQNILVGKIDLTDGDITDSSGVVANLDGTGLPLTTSDLDAINPITTNRLTRFFDIGTKQGKTTGWYAQRVNLVWTYYYFYLDPTTYAVTRVNSGINAPLFYGTHYVGGVSLDRNGNNTLYLSGYTTGLMPWRINQYTINSSMSLSYVSTQADSADPLIRPVSPVGENSVVFPRADTYNSFEDFQGTMFERTRD